MNQLIAELDGFAEDLARDGASGVEIVASASQQLARLERENTALRNEIARLNGQTMWICSCGGTDCAGQKENAALRSALTLIRSTTDESGLSQAQVIETIGNYCDEILGKETRT